MLKLTVSQDGSGDFSSISEAVLAVPYELEAEICIGPGIYREKLVCEKRALTLRGAGADATTLIFGDGGKLPHPDGRPTHTFRSYTAFFSGGSVTVEVGSKAPETTTMVAYLSRDIRNGDMDTALRRLQTFLSTIPQCDNTKYEGHYQQVFYIIFSLLGYYVDVEVRTPRGRVDIVLRTKTTLYVMELKLDGSADEALRQIEEKGYALPFAKDSRKLYKIGVNFSSEIRGIVEWKIVEDNS